MTEEKELTRQYQMLGEISRAGIEGANDVSSYWTGCATGSVLDIISKYSPEDRMYPKASIFCGAVADKFFDLNLWQDLARQVGEGNPQQGMQEIVNASAQDQNFYTRPSGEKYPLNCGLSSMVADVIGRLNANDRTFENISEAEIENRLDACYEDVENYSTRLAFGAGFRRGQLAARQDVASR